MIEPSSISILVIAIIALYFLFGIKYQVYLQETYGYRLLGLPLVIAVIGAALPSILSFFGVDGYTNPGTSTLDIVVKMLTHATPGVVLATIGCLVKTRRPLICLVNIPIIYLVSFVAGVYAAVAVMAAIAIFFLGGFASEGARTASAKTVVKYEDRSNDIDNL